MGQCVDKTYVRVCVYEASVDVSVISTKNSQPGQTEEANTGGRE